MLKVTIGDKAYDVTNDWCDISLRTFGELCKIEAPEALLELWKVSDDAKKYSAAFDKIDRKDRLKTFPAFYGQVIGILSSMDETTLDSLESTLREEFYYEYFHPIYISTLLSAPVYRIAGKIEEYHPEATGEFNFKDKVFGLPSSQRVFGNVIPLKDEPIVTFAEASDIMIALEQWREEGIEAMATVVATYCREIISGVREPYDEEKTLLNTELFKGLDMENVWRVFFCISRALEQSPNIIKTYSTEQEAKARKRAAASLTTG